MKNPIGKFNMFATPDSVDALCARIEQLSGAEKTIAYTYAAMMMNLCSEMVNKELQKDLTEA